MILVIFRYCSDACCDTCSGMVSSVSMGEASTLAKVKALKTIAMSRLAVFLGPVVSIQATCAHSFFRSNFSGFLLLYFINERKCCSPWKLIPRSHGPTYLLPLSSPKNMSAFDCDSDMGQIAKGAASPHVDNTRHLNLRFWVQILEIHALFVVIPNSGLHFFSLLQSW